MNQEQGKKEERMRGRRRRNVILQVLAASKTALDSGTVATYLTQMWIGNIMQTIGWTIASSLNPANSGR